jgi:hypothetical protein
MWPSCRVFMTEQPRPQGLAGRHSEELTTWHLRGSLFLTVYEWNGASRTEDHV